MNIRRATATDVAEVLALERACPTAAHWSSAEYLLIFDAGAASRIALLARNPEVAGFIIARTAGPEWEIENVVVAPEQRGRGIGLALVNAIVEQARSAGAESIALEVRASNVAARALYRRAGFAEVGLRRSYYSNPQEDAVLYSWNRSLIAGNQVQK